jgi:hypothetical protein
MCRLIERNISEVHPAGDLKHPHIVSENAPAGRPICGVNHGPGPRKYPRTVQDYAGAGRLRDRR